MVHPRFPWNVWALVAALSLLMLPSLFRSRDACRGFHLEKSDMTTQVKSNNHRWDVLEKEKGTAHKCAIFVWMCHNQGTIFSDLPAFINQHINIQNKKVESTFPPEFLSNIKVHIFLVLAAPAFASPNAACPGTDQPHLSTK